MGLTLSHISALRALRRIRASNVGVCALEPATLTRAEPVVGKRWSEREFVHESWHWQLPRTTEPLHALIPNADDRIRYAGVVNHRIKEKLPPGSILRLDERASMVCPELLFVQMAEVLEVPQLAALGNELCGNFSCSELDPAHGGAQVKVPQATSCERLASYIHSLRGVRGLMRARTAMRYVCDNALSVPEAVLAVVYSLPVSESGYAMGPLTLNDRRVVEEDAWTGRQKTRVPDLLFSFAPVGINYDGEEHLDLRGIVRLTEAAYAADGERADQLRAARDAQCDSVRAKYVDDIRRNRELAAAGRVVLPLTKEDLYAKGGLDAFTRQVLRATNALFGVDIASKLYILDDTALARDRWDLLSSLLYDGWGA